MLFIERYFFICWSQLKIITLKRTYNFTSMKLVLRCKRIPRVSSGSCQRSCTFVGDNSNSCNRKVLAKHYFSPPGLMLTRGMLLKKPGVKSGQVRPAAKACAFRKSSVFNILGCNTINQTRSVTIIFLSLLFICTACDSLLLCNNKNNLNKQWLR